MSLLRHNSSGNLFFSAGASLLGQQSMSPYLALPSVLQRSPLVSRSKVPKVSTKKARKREKDESLKQKRKVDVKRQTLVEPILPEEPSSVDDLLQDDSPENYKRQFILTPALETLQQLQPVQPMIAQQSLQPQLRQFQLQQLLQQQPLSAQPIGMQPLGMESVAGLQPAVGMQQVGISRSPQLGNVLPFESTPIRYMTSSLVSPIENLGSSLAGRPSPRMISPITSPLVSPSISSSTLMSPLLSSGFSRPQNALSSIQGISPGSLFQDRSVFHRQLGFGYPRRFLGRPQYRRRLHNFREEEDLDGMHPEILGKEEVTTPGSYTTERLPSSDAETLINSPVGFGPITVEAKTAEGARAAQAAGEDKRHNINRPVRRNHTRLPKRKNVDLKSVV